MRRLHATVAEAAGRDGDGRVDAHALIHDVATAAFAVDSLKDCTVEQLRGLEARLDGLDAAGLSAVHDKALQVLAKRQEPKMETETEPAEGEYEPVGIGFPVEADYGPDADADRWTR